MKYVLTFVKTDRMIYISHLDLMRAFLRALRTGGLAPSYSQGFNPHPKMSFALPLPLGVHSVCELLEFETGHGAAVGGIPALALPEGLRVTGFREKPPGYAKPLASYVTAASYEIMCPGISGAPGLMEAFFAEEHVWVAKRAKRGKGAASADAPEARKDIRPQMLGWEEKHNNMHGRMLVHVTLASGAGNVLNPLRFFEAFCRHAGLDKDALCPVITRTAILAGKEVCDFA
ncbi:MAG: TIGR03936 family radical SAM-associated protein [Clostridiales Family XIII bacterium]|jgi:radical SAM-linked protein|nr:TIGR03936 family radical SAM-associated protein [Clostridiales Family XIII bacterium]